MQATIMKHEHCILAFLGFINMKYGDDYDSLSLEDYRDPWRVVSFVSYIMARGALRGHVLKHVSLGRKIVCYLAQSDITDEQREKSVRVQDWYTVLQSQLGATMAHPEKKKRPDMVHCMKWADTLADHAEATYQHETRLNPTGVITYSTAQMVQAAIVAKLVIGECLNTNLGGDLCEGNDIINSLLCISTHIVS